jgi:MoxR-like ATPase
VGSERVRDVAAALIAALGRVVRGHDAAVRDLVAGFLAGGHVLLEGPPGLGKTLLVRSLAALVRAEFRRIQFTPDLMPADVTGTTVFRPATGTFEFVPGPLFAEIVLADEINRTPPKVQAALLEAMAERQVTLDGKSRPLPQLFFVAATQNPIEYEGTYPLPEAQLDRFFLEVRVPYPTADAERALLDAHADRLELVPAGADTLEPVVDAASVPELRQAVAAVYVEPSVLDYVVRLVRATREHRRVALGASSRAAVVLMFAAKAAAAIDGRAFVRPDDVKAMAPAVLRHRLLLRPEAEVEGIDADAVVAELLARLDPRGEAVSA